MCLLLSMSICYRLHHDKHLSERVELRHKEPINQEKARKSRPSLFFLSSHRHRHHRRRRATTFCYYHYYYFVATAAHVTPLLFFNFLFAHLVARLNSFISLPDWLSIETTQPSKVGRKAMTKSFGVLYARPSPSWTNVWFHTFAL